MFQVDRNVILSKELETDPPMTLGMNEESSFHPHQRDYIDIFLNGEPVDSIYREWYMGGVSSWTFHVEISALFVNNVPSWVDDPEEMLTFLATEIQASERLRSHYVQKALSQ